MIDDATLLRRYAADRSDAAFAEFVQRHVSLVYSAALRRLGGDAHRAQDVTQVVFCAVARDARKLSQHVVLTGWLYTATRNAVIDVIRSESRRRTREEEAHMMQETAPETPADWSRLRPVLDRAMDELSATDREAVLLRFFEGRAFADIGTTLGLSEEAARKRVDRALDKLGGLLRRHKIASTSAALAALLAGETVSAAPAGLAASVTGAALATGAATTAAALFTVTKLQAGLAALVLAGGATGLVVQQKELSAQREVVAAVQQQLAKVTAEKEATAVQLRNTRAATTSTPGTTRPTPGSGTTSRPRLPLTNNRPQDRARVRRQYDAFFATRQLSPEQQERFIDASLYQDEARDDLQKAVATAGMNGESAQVERIRRKLYEPAMREFSEVLGGDAGLAARRAYDDLATIRLSYIDTMQSELAATSAALSPEQIEQMVPLLRKHTTYVQESPTDIVKWSRVDWDALVAEAKPLLTPAQAIGIRAFGERHKDQHFIARSNRPHL